MSAPEQITERITLNDTTYAVDSPAKVIRAAALLGRTSKNGYVYTEAAQQAALKLYDGVSVHVPVAGDHGHAPVAGVVRNPLRDGDTIRGDIHCFDTDAGRTLLGLAEQRPHNYGCSHVVFARRSDDKTQVVEVTKVIRVDVVTDPATTSTLSEKTTPPTPLTPMAETTTPTLNLEEIREQIRTEERAKHATSLKTYTEKFGADGPVWLGEGLTLEQCWERRAVTLTEQVQGITKERDALQEKLDSLSLGEKKPLETALEEQAKEIGIPIRIAK